MTCITEAQHYPKLFPMRSRKENSDKNYKGGSDRKVKGRIKNCELGRIIWFRWLAWGLSEDYVFDDFEFALDLLAMISYSRADRTR
jgi:hypothetical protein